MRLFRRAKRELTEADLENHDPSPTPATDMFTIEHAEHANALRRLRNRRYETHTEWRGD